MPSRLKLVSFSDLINREHNGSGTRSLSVDNRPEVCSGSVQLSSPDLQRRGSVRRSNPITTHPSDTR